MSSEEKKQVNMWLPADVVEAVDRLAASERRSRNNFIALILEEFVKRNETRDEKVVESVCAEP